MPPPPTPIPTIAMLLSLVPDRPTSVLQSLAQHPNLAPQQDGNGYSLLHAASSYAQLEVLRTLVQIYNVDVNLRDEDGQNALFVAETVEVARCLVEELGVDVDAKDDEGSTAIETIRNDGEFLDVADYLQNHTKRDELQMNGVQPNAHDSEQTNGIHPPPPLPPNVQINMGTMEELPAPATDAEGAPDPEFRRRIEELAARDDFQGEEGQAQLRELIADAVRGVSLDANSDTRGGSRRRV